MLKIVFSIGFLIAVFGCQTGLRKPAQTPKPQTLKILTLGDSLTSGIANNGGYRPHLYNLLKKAGFSVDFIGSSQEGPLDLPDRDHEGHGGYRIDQVGLAAEKILGESKPDIILLGAGGNDISQNYETKTAPQRLIHLTQKIHQLSPSSIIIVQSRPPRADSLNSKVVEFNSELKKEITNEMKHNKQLYFQDNFKLLSTEDIGPDGFHPNVRGNEKLAEGWMGAIQQYMNSPRGD